MPRIAPLVLAAAAASAAGCGDAPPPAGGTPGGFVGAAACAACHPEETEKWRASDHFRSMEVPDEKTVLGDFGQASFDYDGARTTFSKSFGAWRVRTDGAEGLPGDHTVAYTFGFRPLQQYLVAMPGGRMQALSVCWDSRPAAEGGQRWFHLHPDEQVIATHPFHWTGPSQNWNHMCADCHSTNVVKGYDAAKDAFATTWTDLNVACEACHGPGADHVAWAKARADAPPKDEDSAPDDPRLAVRLRRPPIADWTFATGAPTASRAAPDAFRAEVETCARCHARREPNRATYVFGRPLADSFNTALLTEDLYHADGQIKEEVYEYGSFLQSKMYRRGVSCGDCHDPHDGKVAAADNRLCVRCHLPETFDRPSHHFHEEGTAAARCVACHMPAQNFMVVDARRDHSLRVPRPDLTPVTGAPNACNGCHAEKTPEWAAAAMTKWYGEKGRVGTPHWSVAIAAAREAKPGAAKALLAAAGDTEIPPIARATAVSMLAEWMGPDAFATVERASQDADPLVRRAAAGTLDALPPELRLSIGMRLLADDVRGVRIAAASSLAPLLRTPLAPVDAGELGACVAEYENSQRVNADRAEAHANLGVLQAAVGDAAAAEAEFRTALAMRPSFERAAVNLADVLRAAGRDAEGERVLRDVIPRALEPGDAHHALGLLLVRARRMDEALAELTKAAEKRPADSHYAYVLAVALDDAGRTGDALSVLRRAHERRPANPELLRALADFTRRAGDLDAALGWAKKLRDESLGDPAAAALVDELERARGR